MPMPPAPSRRSMRKSPICTPASSAVVGPAGPPAPVSVGGASCAMLADYRYPHSPAEVSPRRGRLGLAVQGNPNGVADADPRPLERIELDFQAPVRPAPAEEGHLAHLLLAPEYRVAQRDMQLATLQPAGAAHVPRRVALVLGVVTLNDFKLKP